MAVAVPRQRQQQSLWDFLQAMDEDRDQQFIQQVMDLLAQHLIIECKHMKSVDKKSMTFPVNTPAALTGFAVEAVKKYGQHIS